MDTMVFDINMTCSLRARTCNCKFYCFWDFFSKCERKSWAEVKNSTNPSITM